MLIPTLKPFCRIRADLAAPTERGSGKGAKWRTIPIVGGVVEGDRLRGTVMNLGADWQTIYEDGYAELDTRYAIETHDGAVIDVRNFGFRHGPEDVLARVAAGETVDPALYYMRTHPRFHSGDPRYRWLNRTIFLGTGQRMANSVLIDIFEVL